MTRSGIGECHGGVSVLNAIPTGVGGALGVGLRIKARVTLMGSNHVLRGTSVVRGSPEPLSTEVLEAILSVLNEVTGYSGGLVAEVESEIPVAVGLKSSSALVNSLMMACLNALGVEVWSIEWLAALGVRASRRAGLTVTGAFDDSLATLGSGVYVTDNHALRVIKHVMLADDGLYAVLLIPPTRNPIQSVDPRRFRELSPYYEVAVREAIKGEWVTAANINGLLTAIATGVNPKLLAWTLSLRGVIAAGVSGKGPALYALTHDPEAVAEAWVNAGLGGEVIIAKVLGGGDG